MTTWHHKLQNMKLIAEIAGCLHRLHSYVHYCGHLQNGLVLLAHRYPKHGHRRQFMMLFYRYPLHSFHVTATQKWACTTCLIMIPPFWLICQQICCSVPAPVCNGTVTFPLVRRLLLHPSCVTVAAFRLLCVTELSTFFLVRRRLLHHSCVTVAAFRLRCVTELSTFFLVRRPLLHPSSATWLCLRQPATSR